MSNPNPILIGSVPVGFTQQISTGGTLDGTAPSGSIVFTTTNDRQTWAANTVGGLFDFGPSLGQRVGSQKTLTLMSLEMVLGGQATWQAAVTDGLTNASANDIVFASGTTDTTVFLPESPNVFLLQGQQIKITTTGTAASAWLVTVKVALTAGEHGIFY